MKILVYKMYKSIFLNMRYVVTRENELYICVFKRQYHLYVF